MGCPLFLPNAGNSYNARVVNSDGTLNNNNAYNGNYGVRPALIEHRNILSFLAEIRGLSFKGEDIPPRKGKYRFVDTEALVY